MTGSDGNPLSEAESAFYTIFVGKAVSYLVGEGLSEMRALYVLDLALAPSRVYLRYRGWSPEQREDVARALERLQPTGGLLNVIQKAYQLAEERVAKLRPVVPQELAPAIDSTTTRPVSPADVAPRGAWLRGFGSGLFFAVAVLLFLLVAAYVFARWPFASAA